MVQAPDWYSSWRATLDFDRIDYGVGGIELLQPAGIPEGQYGFAMDGDGTPITGTGPGDWRPEWLVIGQETACGDPIFVTTDQPHRVLTAVHGEGNWEPNTVAPSLAMFKDCLAAFRVFAQGRNSPVELERNKPSRAGQIEFVEEIKRRTANDEDAWAFWAIQIDFDPEA